MEGMCQYETNEEWILDPKIAFDANSKKIFITGEAVHTCNSNKKEHSTYSLLDTSV